MDFQEIKTKKQECEREIEEIISRFEKCLPKEITLESAVVVKTHDKPAKTKCSIKLEMEEL
jgi:predicted component of type VI protein secretion system